MQRQDPNPNGKHQTKYNFETIEELEMIKLFYLYELTKSLILEI